MTATASIRRGAVAFLVVAALVLGACAKEDGDSEEVREFIDATLLEPHRFVFSEQTPSGLQTTVQGIVEDDFRYKARLAIDGDPVLDRVVSDDTAAVRFLQPEVLGRYLDKEVISEVDTETDREGVDVITALQSKRWVVDPGGAPPLLRAKEAETDNGVDPIFDAQEMMSRARELTLLTNTGFVEYSENSIAPTYRTDEDPFPRPEEGSGVTRYDLPQAEFAKSVDSGQVVLPSEAQFRKFSVYVKDGQVVRISESIGVSASVLDDFESYMVQLINETAPPEIAEGFRTNVESLEGQEKADFLLESVNTLRELRGDPIVRFRISTYELLDIGDPTLGVDVPSGDTIEGDLAVLVNLGVKPLIEEGAGTGTGDDDAAPADDGSGGVPATTPPDPETAP